jgi:hypothetical protein
MRIILCLVVVLACCTVYADCPSGVCSVNRPVKTVTNGAVQTVRTVTKGTVQLVTPPYQGRCANGRCRVR